MKAQRKNLAVFSTLMKPSMCCPGIIQRLFLSGQQKFAVINLLVENMPGYRNVVFQALTIELYHSNSTKPYNGNIKLDIKEEYCSIHLLPAFFIAYSQASSSVDSTDCE